MQSMTRNRLSRQWCRSGAAALLVLLAALQPVAGFAQQTDGNDPAANRASASRTGIPAPAKGSFTRLRGTLAGTQGAETGDDIFTDGGIEEANRDGLNEDETIPAQRPKSAAATEDDAVSSDRARAELPQGPVAAALANGQPDPRDNVAADPVETGTARRPETDPFLPAGFRAGSWNVFVRLDQAIGYTTNANKASGGTSGSIAETDASLTARSDWSRHEASIEATAAYERALSGDDPGIPKAGIAGNLRLDLADGYSANLRSNYNYSTEATTSNSLGGSVSQRPGVHAFGGSAELLRGGAKLVLSVKASADRTSYEQATLGSGGVLDQSDRDNTLYQLTGRAGYEASPALQPFLQAGIGRRLHDLAADRNGDERDSTLVDLRAGVLVDLGEKLRGEIAAGYLAENHDAATLATLGTPTLNGNLVWSPQRGTTVTFTGATSLNGSTTAGNSGSVSRSFGVSAERQIRDRLSANASLAMKIDSYENGSSDVTLTAATGIKYWVNRFLAVSAGIELERFDSSTAGNSWDATTARIGLTLQR